MHLRNAVTAFAVLALASGAALANDNRGGRMFDRVDADKDGRISAAEARAFGDQRFQKMDVDGSGTVTLAEMEAAVRKRQSQRLAKRFENLDVNGDGVVVRAEFDEIGAKRFARMDRNSDGAVTRDEARKAHKQRRDKRN